ncbi:MAG: hypothetical protein KFF49_09895 [Bacteroidales bacterium]|nr:hypothetical protein [Bacteroidales bacterium]
MKKKIFFFSVYLALAAGLTSCEGMLENCETCRYNVYVNDVLSYSEMEAEYCGADLITRKSAPDVITGEGTAHETVTKFECDD